jgi:DMSO/TMAO reductase YedYZ heme-binding membrane subunit
MAITSFDRTTAWLGRRRWRQLHLVGMYAIFGIFVFSYAPRFARSAQYAAYTLLCLGAFALRIVAWQRRRPR